MSYLTLFYEAEPHKMNTSNKSEKLGNRLAIVHDFLIQMGGAEKVVEVMANAFPSAPIYTSATKGPNLFPVFKSREVNNTWMQKIHGLDSLHKMLFFLYPLAFKSLRIQKEKETVWISSSSFSKWIPKPGGSKFVCYCHTPPRYFWTPDEYLRNEIANPLLRSFVRALMPIFRWSDKRQSDKIDVFVANSLNTQARIKQCYNRDSVVIYPPVDVERFQMSTTSDDYFLIVSRLVSYKRIDLAVKACSEAGRKLVVIGDGPDRARLESMAGETVTFLGRAPEEVVEEKMSNCAGFIFPGCEDFGITPVEAQACGKPVIAFRGGGALETVIDGKTGVFFNTPDSNSLGLAIEHFDVVDWEPEQIRANAERFSTDRYLSETIELLNSVSVETETEAVTTATTTSSSIKVYEEAQAC